jgi:ABC-type glycerol-3-phosphate transport system substrate-binding protein
LGDTPVPQSFEEVIAFAQKYNNPGQNKWALRWQVDDSYHNYFFLTAFGMRIFGPDMDDYRNPGFDSPAAGQGVDFFRSLRSIYNVNVADADWNNTVAAFQNGDVPLSSSPPPSRPPPQPFSVSGSPPSTSSSSPSPKSSSPSPSSAYAMNDKTMPYYPNA